MTPRQCPRLFQAEAIRDGRLTGAECASFERHVASCVECAREAQALEGIGRSLRAIPAERVDDLHVRRERTRLLAAFDRELLTPGESRGARRRWLLVAGVAVVAVALVAVRGHYGDPSRDVARLRAVVQADPQTRWSERIDGDREVLVLDRGAIRVAHAASARRLIVLLPDGELEDTGTTFTVRADDGRTTRVAVQEGSIVLRLIGRSPLAVGAGEVWAPLSPSTIASAVAGPTSSGAPSTSIESPRSAPAPGAPLRAAASVASAHRRDPAAELRDATAALDRGDNREAAEALGRFLRSHPGDGRAEDAAYLRVIALQRCGDLGAMNEAARDYLQRFPAGFRSAEVETLAQ